MGTRIASVIVAVAAASSAKPPAAAKSPPLTLEAIREEAQALMRVQNVLSWYTRTVGEPSIQAETYKGHERLLSRESVQRVAAAARAAKDSDERRALGFLRSYLAGKHLGLQIARFDDEAQNAELKAAVTLSWEKQPVPYKQLDILAANEKDATRRGEIESARAGVWKSTLNPILERKETEAQKLARELGYRSYVALAEELRLVNLKELIAMGERLRQSTEATYAELLADVAKRELGITPDKLRRSDLARLRKAARFERFFPRELMIPSFKHFLAGIGLDLKTVAGTEIRIDDALHPLKEPRAACYPIRVPSDIRITVKPTGGLGSFVTLFHEGGHALHYANTTSKRWEFQQLGPKAATDGFAETFAYAWTDPAWLRRYRVFVATWNKEQKTSYPTMTDDDIRDVVRQRVFDELYLLRRYAAAKLIYEAALHGGDPALWADVHRGQTADLITLYRELFTRAYGFALSDEDALRYLTDVDDLFYSADYTRAFGLANTVHEGLRAKVGPDWYGDKRAGDVLKRLYADGSRLQPDEIAKEMGFARFDYAPTEARVKRLLGP